MKKSKKLLFVIPKMKTGGIQSSFLSLLYEISNEDFDIDVLCFDDDNVQNLPPFVKALKSNKILRMLMQEQSQANKESRMLGLFRLLCGACIKLFGQKYVYKLLFLTCKRLTGYDVAISFAQTPNRSLSGGFNEFVLYRVCAKQKISFMHCDYNQAGINTSYSRYIYNRFDKIAAVSKGVKKVFVSECPEFSDKTYVVHNCHRLEIIKSQSKNSPVCYGSDVVNLITIARISAEKGHIRMLDVLNKLIINEKNFCWHVIGGGSRLIEAEMKNKIESLGLNDNIKLYGNQSNPYRFLKNADCLVVPSFHEAAPVVYGEAVALGIPIVTTNTSSAEEFVKKPGFGIVCDNSTEGLYNALVEISNDRTVLEECKKNISSCEFSNKTAKEEFLYMINDNIGE